MSVIFEINIDAIRATSIGEMENVIKEVDITVRGVAGTASFELPQSVELGDPDPQNFIQFGSLTKSDIIAFVESSFENIDVVKAHIQYVLDKEVAKTSLIEVNLPWVTVESQDSDGSH